MEYFQVLRNANDQEFFKLKEQLMMTFKDQMELRRSLMELGNTSMEISLESSRNTLILSDWETEQSKAKEVCERLDFTWRINLMLLHAAHTVFIEFRGSRTWDILITIIEYF